MNFNKLLACAVGLLLSGCANSGTLPPIAASSTPLPASQSPINTDSVKISDQNITETINQNQILSEHFFNDFLAFFHYSDQDILLGVQGAAAYLAASDLPDEITYRLLLPTSLLLFNTVNSIPVVDSNSILLSQIYLTLADLGAQMVLISRDKNFSCNTFGLSSCIQQPAETTIPAYLLYYFSLVNYRDLIGQTANLLMQEELAAINTNLNEYIQSKNLLKTPIIKLGHLQDAHDFLHERQIK